MSLILTAALAAAIFAPMKHTPPITQNNLKLIARDTFADPKLPQWKWELEDGGTVTAANGIMDINVPKGATIWFRTELHSPVIINYEARAVQELGPNDRVSDMNCFWMAQDPKHPHKLMDIAPRSGKFADYDTLTTYYVGQGGNGNTTTRFRRYIGTAGDRPMRPQDDLHDPSTLLTPNKWRTITLVANHNFIAYNCDGAALFELHDTSPYTSGWFGIRTTDSHLQVRNFTVLKLTTPVK